jgi:hypothetical protein
VNSVYVDLVNYAVNKDSVFLLAVAMIYCLLSLVSNSRLRGLQIGNLVVVLRSMTLDYYLYQIFPIPTRLTSYDGFINSMTINFINMVVTGDALIFRLLFIYPCLMIADHTISNRSIVLTKGNLGHSIIMHALTIYYMTEDNYAAIIRCLSDQDIDGSVVAIRQLIDNLGSCDAVLERLQEKVPSLIVNQMNGPGEDMPLECVGACMSLALIECLGTKVDEPEISDQMLLLANAHL